MDTREPAVDGSFYPASPARLRADIDSYLAQVQVAEPLPKAVIAPHAGFIYSGPIAASVYAHVRQGHDTYRRVVLLGPAHRMPIIGLAASSAFRFETPLGSVPVDRPLVGEALKLEQVRTSDEAHRLEHCLEVQLPFLQTVLDEFQIAPLLVGRAMAAQVAEVLDRLWGGDDTLIVVSSDLSHFYDYDYARECDERTGRAILDLEPVGGDDACGSGAINGLLEVARTRGLAGKLIDLRNSADTAGGHDRVVGYGAFLFS